jgi:endonuclease-8
MPEGPSLVIAKEAMQSFKGQKIVKVTGYVTIDKKLIINKTIKEIHSWGKHLLINLGDITIRIHFLLFGSYRINEKSNTSNHKLGLILEKGELNFYVCDILLIKEDFDGVYDWSADVMNENWSVPGTRKKLKLMPERLVCDVLMDQQIFAGVGNIIKNEVLFRVKVHPESSTGKLPASKLTALIKEAATYSFDFLKWKKAGVLSRNWQIYKRQNCPDCGAELIVRDTGKSKRRSYFCENCQTRF